MQDRNRVRGAIGWVFIAALSRAGTSSVGAAQTSPAAQEGPVADELLHPGLFGSSLCLVDDRNGDGVRDGVIADYSQSERVSVAQPSGAEWQQVQIVPLQGEDAQNIIAVEITYQLGTAVKTKLAVFAVTGQGRPMQLESELHLTGRLPVVLLQRSATATRHLIGDAERDDAPTTRARLMPQGSVVLGGVGSGASSPSITSAPWSVMDCGPSHRGC